ncbi:MAG: NHL repeat-containing protein [Desulfobacterales bacterium]|nr:MAG: NHL repeat-containing protein [Desulfobacterales bacterium]
MLNTRPAFNYFLLSLFFLLIPQPAHAVECLNSQFLFEMKPGADQPSDIAIAPNGDTYLVDGVNNRIIVLDSAGGWKLAFGTQGKGQGEFEYPLGIDISDEGRVFIADSGNHRIQVFDLNGQFLYKFEIGAGPGEKPPDPVDVLVSKLKGYIYVSDNDNHKIRVYDQRGIFQFEWGNFGEQPGEFRYPGILAVNEFNQVFVVDVLNTRVQKFDPFGNFITDIGAWGVLPGKFFRPKGVAVDKKNRVFVSDSYMGLIQVFTDLGKFLGVVCENNKKRQFITPVGLAITAKNDRLQVVEMRGNKISVLQMLD